MDKLPRFAKVFAGRRRIVEMDISLRLRNLAEFFNSLLEPTLVTPTLAGLHRFIPPASRDLPSRESGWTG